MVNMAEQEIIIIIIIIIINIIIIISSYSFKGRAESLVTGLNNTVILSGRSSFSFPSNGDNF